MARNTTEMKSSKLPLILIFLLVFVFQISFSFTATVGTPSFLSYMHKSEKKFHAVNSALHMSAVVNTPTASFSERMRNIVLKKPKTAVTRPTTNNKPANVRVVNTLEEYKDALGAGSNHIVVVRFYAKWCKACKAIQPAFYRLATVHSDVVFIEVPVTEKNANLHQGLAVPSLPYGHIYHPTGGLVEELKISKKFFARFAQVLQSYVCGGCDLPDGESVAPFTRDEVESFP